MAPFVRSDVAWLCGVFALSRAASYASGVRFDAQKAADFWHFIDPALLKTKLVESLLYLHAQPPLFNALLGALHKLFGPLMPAVFALFHWALGLALLFGIYRLACELGAHAKIALGCATLFAVHSATILYENFLFYTYSCAALLLVGARAVLSFARSGSPRSAAFLFASLSALSLIRSMFAPVWFVAQAVAVIWIHKRRQFRTRKFWGLALGFALLVLSVPFKNLILYGEFTTSTWQGMSLARVTLDRMPGEMRKQWSDEGRLSQFAKVGSFRALSEYPGVLASYRPKGVALLDNPEKRPSVTNFHHAAFIEISNVLAGDALTVIRERPDLYLKSVRKNVAQTFEPATTYKPLVENRARLRMWEVVLGKVLLFPLALTAVLLLIYASVKALRGSFAERCTFAYMWFQIVFVIVVGALCERSENQRFRFMIDPLLVTLGAVLLSECWTSLKERGRRLRARA